MVDKVGRSDLVGVLVMMRAGRAAFLAELSSALPEAAIELLAPCDDPARLLAAADRYDFLLLQEGSLGDDTPGLCGWLRGCAPQLCTIVITGAPPVVRRWLEAGADDAFSMGVPAADVAARVRAVVRRQPSSGDWVGDLARQAALTPAETRIVRVLAERGGRSIGAEELARAALGHSNRWTVVYVHINRIRRKLPSGIHLHAAYGRGYWLSVLGAPASTMSGSGAALALREA